MSWEKMYKVVRPNLLQNHEFDFYKLEAQDKTEKEQLSYYQEVNEELFGWLYFAPYEVLESLKSKEDAWYKLAFKHFYEGVDFTELLVRGDTRYGHSKYPREPSEIDETYTSEDPLTLQLKQETFMTAQFCWWKSAIESRYPEVFQTMTERFSDGLGGKIWLVGGGELQEHIPIEFLRNYTEYVSVKGVFTWSKLREWYSKVYYAPRFEKWYTLWDCNMNILKLKKDKDIVLSIPKINWSNSTPTYGNTFQSWSKIKDEINKQLLVWRSKVLENI